MISVLRCDTIDLEGEETEEANIKSTVSGTIGILQACLNSKTVKRVVYTSSPATITLNDKGLDIMDETIWSDVAYDRRIFGGTGMASYGITRTLTDKAALEYAWSHCNPFSAGSVRSSMAMIIGHTFFSEYPEAKGRYICSAVEITIDILAECLSAGYPEYPIPTAE